MTKETYIKALQKILDNEATKQELLKDLVTVSEALLSITEYECCAYGFDEALKIAEKYANSEEGKHES